MFVLKYGFLIAFSLENISPLGAKWPELVGVFEKIKVRIF